MAKHGHDGEHASGECKKARLEHHHAYKCHGSCGAATDRPFKCGAEDCDRKGVALEKVEKPVVYFCDGKCKGTIFTPTNCGDKECDKSDVPLVAKVMCVDCSKAYDEDGKPHACESCISVIDVSQLPEIAFSTAIPEVEEEETAKHHYAYRCGGSCAAATDRPFNCGAEDCDRKGVALEKVEKPVVYFCDGECKGVIFTPTACGASDCSRAGVPLVAKVMCEACTGEYEKDQAPHACAECVSVIRTSKLPDEVVYTVDISED